MSANEYVNQLVWKNKFHLRRQRKEKLLLVIWNAVAWLALVGIGTALLWWIVR